MTVHAGAHRQHAAFQGASVMASLPNFSNLCVWQEDWQEIGPSVLEKWAEDVITPEYDSDGSFSGSLASSRESLAASGHESS